MATCSTSSDCIRRQVPSLEDHEKVSSHEVQLESILGPRDEEQEIKETRRQELQEQDIVTDTLHITNGKFHTVTESENTSILKKIDRHLMPVMFMIYFLQVLDKQTLYFSSIFGLTRDTYLTGDEYSLLGSVVYIAQLVMQPLSAYLLVKFPLSLYIPFIVTSWGATLACMAAARDFKSLFIARFFLGGFEASIAAAFTLTVQNWYRRHEQGLRIAIWYSSYALVNIFGSLFMFGVGHIPLTSLHFYQLVFLILGIVTVLVGILCFFIFPDNPTNNKFLNAEEMMIAIERIRANQQGLGTKIFNASQLVEMILDIKCWCGMIMLTLVAIPLTGLSTFGPFILHGFGFDKYKVLLLMIPYGALQFMMIFGAIWAADHFRAKSPIILIVLIPCVVGTIILRQTGREVQDQPILIIAYYILSAYSAIPVLVASWLSSNIAGHTKRVSMTTFMQTGSLTGSIIGPLLFTAKEKPYYGRGLTAMLITTCAFGLLTCAMTCYLCFLNQRNQHRRILSGKEADIVDHSMMTVKQVANLQAQNLIELRAFDNLTDLQNDEFIYIY